MEQVPKYDIIFVNMAKNKEKQEPEKPRVSPELISAEKQYRREKIIVGARPILKRIGLYVWIGIDVLLLAVFLGYIGYYLISGNFQDRRQVAQIGENVGAMRSVSEARAAQDLQIGPTSVFAVAEDRYDVYGEIENSNIDWYATFDYYFTSSQGDSQRYSGSVMPAEIRPIVALRQEFMSRPNNVELVLEDFRWHRVPAEDIEDPLVWMEEHNDFLIEDAEYTFDVEIDGEQIPRTSFTITNSTPYSYWNPEFIVIIRRAGNVAGVNATTISGFASGETRDVNVNWFGAAPSSGTVEIVPNINYFDSNAYMPPSGEVMDDVRDVLQDRR